MSALGYSVGRNKPYAGGFITEHYGNPASGLHTIQLELNRAIYMDERRRERSAAVRPGDRGFRRSWPTRWPRCRSAISGRSRPRRSRTHSLSFRGACEASNPESRSDRFRVRASRAPE